MKRRQLLRMIGAVAAGFGICSLTLGSTDVDRPNILWITAEDMSLTLGCYGDVYAHTPNIDQFAREGVRYTQAFAVAPVCTPARSTLITGIFASSLGTQHLRGTVPLSSGMKGYPQIMREAGYYCTNNVKEDYNFVTPGSFWDGSSADAHWRQGPRGKPFFSVFNFMTTHQSRTRYEADELEKRNRALPSEARHDPKRVPLPPYYPDTPKVRTNVAAFYTQVTLMDRQVGEILSQLQADGFADNTIVFFYSDHGSGLPRGKRWLHESGLKVPLIIRFPPKYEYLAPSAAGTTTDRLTSFVDFPPTVLSLAGIKAPDAMQGNPFLGSFTSEERQFVIGIRDRIDEVLELSRSIHDGRFQYIRNFMPHRPRMQYSFFSERTPIRQEIRRLSREGKLTGDQAWLMAPNTPVDELYDLANDPQEMNNLAGRPERTKRVERMKRTLFDWMLETRDLSLLHENDMLERANGSMPYEFARDERIYPIERILAVASKVGEGNHYLSDFSRALGDADPGVRYWGATGLAVLGEESRPARAALSKALEDRKSWVRFAAAEACCHIGLEQAAVKILADGLQLRNIKENLHAAQILLAVAEKARPAMPQMRQAIIKAKDLQDHGWYMREVLSHLVEQLEGRP